MFITIDGPDGTGKTTVAKLLVDKINQTPPYKGIYTSEPSDLATGKRIREILRQGGQRTESLTRLFVEDRREHIEKVILPQMKNDHVIVCDRYKYSTIAYQHLQGEEIPYLIELNQDFPSPDLAFILYVENSNILMERINQRSEERELFETKSMLEKSMAIYREMGNYYPQENIIFVQADGEIEQIADKLYGWVLSRIGVRNGDK